jgi:hypothetical protein
MKKVAFTLFMLILLAGTTVMVEARTTPILEKHVFVHWIKPDDDMYVKPDKPGGGTNTGKLWYKYSGLHWESPPVNYVIDTEVDGLPLNDVVAVLTLSFETWDDESATEIFGSPSTGTVTAGVQDNVNGISFGPTGKGIIALTTIWYNPATGEVSEVDTLFSTNYQWSLTGERGKMDLQNIATHEFGHWLILDDLYNKPASTQTMYGYSTYGETIKRSLESGDIAGLETIYGP